MILCERANIRRERENRNINAKFWHVLVSHIEVLFILIMNTSNGTIPAGKSTCFFLEVILFEASSRALYITTVFTSLINAVFLLFAVVGNSIILTAILKTTALRTCSNFFLGNLVLSDLLVGLMVQPLFVLYKIGEALGKYSCLAHALFSTSAWLCAGVSFLTLTALNCERHIAIFSSLRYKSLVKPRRVLKISLVIWLLSLLLVSSRFFGLDNAVFYVICCIIIAVSLLTFLVISIRIHRVVQRHRMQIATSHQGQCWQRQAREAVHARNVAWVTFIFFLCYLPTLAVMIAYTVVDYTVTLKTVYLWSDTLVFLNSSINPGIYCWRNKGIRKAVLKVLKQRTEPVQPEYDRRSRSAAVINSTDPIDVLPKGSNNRVPKETSF